MSEEKKKARGRLKRAVAGAAPELARALGGPLAGAAVETIAKALFGEKDAGEADIEKALQRASPEQRAALRRAELEFRAALRTAAVEEARIAADDRADARARERAMRDRAPAALGGLIIGGFFIVLAAMIAQRLPPGAETEFSIMLGALATMTAAVVNYYFGSSAGSKEKTRLLSRERSPDGAA
ncbi:hypothetical protein [Amphiplicatus metriothermophilus]|uniref:Holin of 3TMs, for gene-transfer release n=1 Tax=Amphiplicatus metriothermophilus TaxID=1519374 RepID=A0A239PVP7_9PROT|nr:hypothetical protein [Amphiplicatus metriothermophilus]MBB5519624.1 hypothetical protein [Amphiplicatus metriothermophilus]SNT74188.1 hypothetical protein SAMN06297382_2096 [Amphiplicatus metriothermophilus]